MLRETITTVLFELDGNLQPMETKTYTDDYFKLLAQKAAPYGFEPKALVAAVWAGTKAMRKNEGTQPNDQRFWQTFAGELGEDIQKLRPVFDKFYAEEFHGAKAATRENPLAKKVVEELKARGYTGALATYPLVPLAGQATRLSWLGLRPQDFALVTSYESCSYCKPNPAYFAQVLEQLGKRPEECLMVGNDVREDMLAAQAVGISTYLITDCMENAGGVTLGQIERGSFGAFLMFAGLA